MGPLLNAAPIPARVVGPSSDLGFDPGSYFFFQDNRRCYWVQAQKNYWTGSAWAPITPSYPASAPYTVKYWFHSFYHPFTGLFWNQLAGGGFDLLYDVNLQQNPDQIDPSGADVFSFSSGYQPVVPPVWWDHDDVTGQDRQYLDFSAGAAFGVYDQELFYHIPRYIAQLLSQNQQFADAKTWFEYIFDPTRQSTDPVPGATGSRSRCTTSPAPRSSSRTSPTCSSPSTRATRPRSARSRPGATTRSTRSSSPTCARSLT